MVLRAAVLRRREFRGHETSCVRNCFSPSSRGSGDGAGAAVRHPRRPAVVVRQPRSAGRTVTVSSDSLQGERTAVTDVNGVYSVPGLPPGHLRRQVRDERDVDRAANGGGPARRRGDDGSGARPGAGHRSRRGERRAPGAGELACRRVQPARRAVLADAGRAHAVRPRRARARPDRQHAEQQPGDDRRRVRLRQRVPDGRRRHQRQRARSAQQPLHRGRDPGVSRC